MQRIADTTFGLDRYAWPLLAILSTWEPDFASFNEQAQAYDVVLQTGVYIRDAGPTSGVNWAQLSMVFRTLGLRKVITFGRDNFRDEIVVTVWGLLPAQPVGHLLEKALEDEPNQQHRFQPAELMNVAGFIREELSTAYRLAQAQA